MVLVDTNVLLDIAMQDVEWFDWSSGKLAPLIDAREAAINPVIYAELAPLYLAARDLDLNLVPPSDFRRLALPIRRGSQRRPPFKRIEKPAANAAPHYRIFSSELTRKRKV